MVLYGGEFDLKLPNAFTDGMADYLTRLNTMTKFLQDEWQLNSDIVLSGILPFL